MTKKLKILHVNAHEQSGGAAKAAYRLHTGLNNNGTHSSMFVLNKTSRASNVFRPMRRLDRFWFYFIGFYETYILKRYPNRNTSSSWSINRYPTPAIKYIKEFNAQITHLHWVYSGMIPIQSFNSIPQPIVWTLHDMWAMTGGCHFSGECLAYTKSCGNCPQLGSGQMHDLSRKTFKVKEKNWKTLAYHLVAPSQWTAQCAQSSPLLQHLPIRIIPNGLDTTIFRPYDRTLARDIFDLPSDKHLVLFGAEAAQDPRKGLHYLNEALQKLASQNLTNIELVIFGHDDAEQIYPFKSHHVGFVRDERLLALLYAAADVLVAPSTQDVGPATVAEALACGTPAVGFKIGGIPDVVEHQKNGFIVTPFDVDHLAKGIQWIISDQENWQKLSQNARQTALDYLDLKKVIQQYQQLYNEVLDSTTYGNT